MRLVFCGTPQFAVPTLRAAIAHGHAVELVVTQPDRRGGRGLELLPPPVKAGALEAGLPVAQPERIKNNHEFRAQLEAIAPDVILVVAYGRIIPKWMLELPRYGNLNLHGSLLPKYRGAAPVQWAIASGEPETGVTTMQLDEGLDTGDILLQRGMPVPMEMTAEDAMPLLAELGAPLMMETLAALENGTLTPRRQNNEEATSAPILTREDGCIDFTRTSEQIYDRWRGFQPWPGAWTLMRGKKLTLAHIAVASRGAFGAPGELIVAREHMHVACGAGTMLEVLEVQLEGRKRMAVAEFLRGHSFSPGEQLG